jgi:hypothetical protein
MDKVAVEPFPVEQEFLTRSQRLLQAWEGKEGGKGEGEVTEGEGQKEKEERREEGEGKDSEEEEDSEEVKKVEEEGDSEEEEEEDSDDEGFELDETRAIPLVLNIKENSESSDEEEEEEEEDGEKDGEKEAEGKKKPKPATSGFDPTLPPPTWNSATRAKLREYSPAHVIPEDALAHFECPWELVLLSRHHHPSVGKWASALLDGDEIIYSGDPLRDFQPICFLDRFAFKNPKKGQKEAGALKAELKTGSIMQPLYGTLLPPSSLAPPSPLPPSSFLLPSSFLRFTPSSSFLPSSLPPSRFSLSILPQPVASPSNIFFSVPYAEREAPVNSRDFLQRKEVTLFFFLFKNIYGSNVRRKKKHPTLFPIFGQGN